MNDIAVVAGGREVPHAIDRIRRYSGLGWSGGAPENWAWRYYDTIPLDPIDGITEVDVLCAAAVHPGLSREELAYFVERRADIDEWLAEVPSGQRLFEISDPIAEHIKTMPIDLDPPSLPVLSKVLHRKRPHLVPLMDRHIADWYRPITGHRSGPEAWAGIVDAMRADELDDKWRLLMAINSVPLEAELWPDLDEDDRPRLSWIRMIDIAIWMGTR